MNLFKSGFLVFSILCLTNCVSRNEYGVERSNKLRFSNKKCADEQVFEKVDTSAIYLYERKVRYSLKPVINGYKFYADNKVAFFINVKKDSLDGLNPKNALMGFYNTCGEVNTIQTAYYHVQAGVYKAKQEFEIKNDTLVVNSVSSPQGSFSTEKFYKQKLKPNQLIYKPDW